MTEPTTPTPTSAASTPREESPWQDDPGYPHRIENHVKVYLHLEETAAGPRWVVSPLTVDGYPLDGVEDGNYCDYEGHPPGARPDWDRQHRMARDLYLPTAAELLPILASALGTSVEGPTVDQLRAASDLLAEHAEWRSERPIPPPERRPATPDASDWHHSDDAGCDLADRAIALLTEVTGQRSHASELRPSDPASDATLMRSMLASPSTTAPTQPGHTTTATSTQRSGPAR